MKRVMFVCVRNSCRSQMAEGFARAISNSLISVTSSGFEPGEVNPIAIQVMSEVGIDISKQTSKPLSDFNPKDYDVVISLCGCSLELPIEWVLREIFDDWQLVDPVGKSIEVFYQVRDEIRTQVTQLMESLS